MPLGTTVVSTIALTKREVGTVSALRTIAGRIDIGLTGAVVETERMRKTTKEIGAGDAEIS